MKKGWLALLAPVAALPLVLSNETHAITGWQTFGSAVGTGRGSLSLAPYISVASTTRRDPATVRITFADGTYAGRTDIDWYLDCWNENTYDSWTRSGSGSYSLPKTITWDPPAWVDFCDLDTTAYHFNTGTLRITEQAQY
jgi:hypothetical protein